ncbi:hypothetical protein ANAEL_03824 [Anaerolineales bacterium]|nr:hypothetical protein ANAEL_03824 [Anaerolineales bacterium]
MSKSESYLEKVVVAVNAAGEPAISAALADRCGYAAADYAAITAKIEPARVAMRQMDAAQSALDQATATFTACFTTLKKDTSSLRRVMNNNLPKKSPLFKKLGFDVTQPKGQEALLAYGENAFTQGRDLLPTESAILTQRKWDTARFTAALENVVAARAANQKQEAAKGASIAATACFYDAIDALDELYRPPGQECPLESGRHPRRAGEDGLANAGPIQAGAARACRRSQEACQYSIIKGLALPAFAGMTLQR